MSSTMTAIVENVKERKKKKGTDRGFVLIT
jgi:hypothetical protein